ncbi:MAG TPA: beta-propeller fold lactonase family protein, partial [Candidatus Acidoferrales bacterium]|nr:beta-propeller fold lactonase family protein [Candidatus Acidoferrales bacterium]
LAVHPLGWYLYVLNRASNSIAGFAIDPATGGLQPVVGSPFDCEEKAWTIAVDAAGEFVEVAHLGSAEMTRFRIDPYTGALDRITQGR